MAADKAFTSQNAEHLVDHSVVMGSSGVNDGMEVMDECMAVNDSMHRPHVKISFHMTF